MLEKARNFTIKTKEATFTVGGKTAKCTKGAGKGEFTNHRDTTEQITFSKCDINGNKKEPCENISTSPLPTTLFYTSEAETEAATEFSLEVNIKCGSDTFAIEGRLMGAVTNSKSGQTVTFAVNSKGKQALMWEWEEGEQVNIGPARLVSDGTEEEATLVAAEEIKAKDIGVFF